MDREFFEGLWATAAVEGRPEIWLSEWQVFEVKMPRKPHRTRHFVGWSIQDRSGMVSSQVESFDPASMRGVTGSGRVYELRGRPGWNADAEHTWRGWMRVNEVVEYADVTASLVERRDSGLATKE